jgi:hypothetical protein
MKLILNFVYLPVQGIHQLAVRFAAKNYLYKFKKRHGKIRGK